MVNEQKEEPESHLAVVRNLLSTGGPLAREQWNLFTDKYAGGIKSPRRVHEHKLKNFVDHYRLGYHLVSQAASLRLLMEHSPGLQEAWKQVVHSTSGQNAKLDPNSYSEEFVKKFLDNLVIDETPVPPRIMLAKKVLLLTEEGIGGFEDEWADYVKGLSGTASLNPADYSTEELQAFLADSDPELLDPAKGDLVYSVEKFLRLDDGGAKRWVDFTREKHENDEFPDPRDCDEEELKAFVDSVAGRIQALKMKSKTKKQGGVRVFNR